MSEKHPTDTELLDYLESRTNGSAWVARESTSGRGFRVHNTSNPTRYGAKGSASVREAIAEAMTRNRPVSLVDHQHLDEFVDAMNQIAASHANP